MTDGAPTCRCPATPARDRSYHRTARDSQFGVTAARASRQYATVDDRPSLRWRLRAAPIGGVLLLVLGGLILERRGGEAGPGDVGNVWDVVGGVVAGGGILVIFVSMYMLRPNWFVDRRAQRDSPEEDHR